MQKFTVSLFYGCQFYRVDVDAPSSAEAIRLAVNGDARVKRAEIAGRSTIAWTGGTRPAKRLAIKHAEQRDERQLRTQLFRKAMKQVRTYWGDSRGLCASVLDQARQQYRYASYDAHATYRT